MKNFDEFSKPGRGTTDSYPPPEYLVQPHKGEKGFFLFKAAFDKLRKNKDKNSYSPSISWRFADQEIDSTENEK
jgi:hypothetical protein